MDIVSVLDGIESLQSTDWPGIGFEQGRRATNDLAMTCRHRGRATGAVPFGGGRV